MKKLAIAVLAAIQIYGTCVVFSKNQESLSLGELENISRKSELQRKMDQVSVGGLFTSFSYLEPGIMKTSGNMVGVQGQWSALASEENKIYVQLQGSFQQGSLDYEGGVFNLNTRKTRPYSYSNDKVSVTKISSFMGRYFELGNGSSKGPLLLIPQVGLNLYFLNDSDDPDPYDYFRRQNYVTIPLRVELIQTFFGDHLLSAHLTYHPSFFFAGSNQSENPEGGESLNFQQSEGSGAEFGANWSMGNFNIGLLYESWRVGKSDSDRGYVEPANKTNFFTLLISYHLF